MCFLTVFAVLQELGGDEMLEAACLMLGAACILVARRFFQTNYLERRRMIMAKKKLIINFVSG